MKLEQLHWDSDFFGIKIGKIHFDGVDADLMSLLKDAQNEQYRLIYVFSPENEPVNQQIISANNGKLVDRKIVYQKTVENQSNHNVADVVPYQSTDLSHTLLNLAYTSGEFSRFRLDANLPTGSFEKLYKEWMVKSLNGSMADTVFVAKDGDKITGFVTLKCGDESGEIGLIAVSKLAQGRGIGTKLIDMCENYLSTRSARILQVPTQQENAQACRFYEKYGFKKQLITNIYHFWMKTS